MIKILIALLLCTSSVFASGGMGPGPGVKSYTSGAYFTETFEGSEYDNAVWTEVGVPNGDYTTAPLCGAQSLVLPSSSSSITSSDLGQDIVSVKAIIRPNSLTNSGDSYTVTIKDATGATTLTALAITPTDYFKISNGTANTTDATTILSATSTYIVWLDYTPGTGSNAITNLYVAVDSGDDCIETKPGTPLLTLTTGTSTLAARVLALRQSNTMSATFLYDNVEVNP